MEARMNDWFIYQFMRPGRLVRDVDSIATQLQGRKYVGTKGVADHQEFFGTDIQMIQ